MCVWVCLHVLYGQARTHIHSRILTDYNLGRPVWKDAMNITLQHGQLSMFSVPPPGSGLILGFILNILDEYGLTPESVNDPNIVLTHHRITEAMKWAYAKRTELGDADFVDMSGVGSISRLGGYQN